MFMTLKEIFYNLTLEKYSILETVIEQAVNTNYEAIFRNHSTSEYDSWDQKENNAYFYSNGTCILREYSAGHDYLNERTLFGSYTKEQGQINIIGCWLGDMMPVKLVLILDENVLTWGSSKLNLKTE
jgi:hypothetical protein